MYLSLLFSLFCPKFNEFKPSFITQYILIDVLILINCYLFPPLEFLRLIEVNDKIVILPNTLLSSLYIII